MRFTLPILAAMVATATAFESAASSEELVAREAEPEADANIELTERSGGRPSCPAVWAKSITPKLTGDFVSNGQCNDLARAAIRAAFHDAGAWDQTKTYSPVDGSLCLNSTENGRGENKGLQDICTYYAGVTASFSVGMGDLIQYAGAAAVVLCPGGQPYQLLVGRTDSSAANDGGLLPDVNADAQSLYQLFLNKGFSAVDLAALLGAHTCSKQFNVDVSTAGAPQDSTPGLWDVKYYSETTAPAAGDFVFQSDKNLAAHPTVGKEFAGFVNNQGKWTGKFGSAMNRMSLLGISSSAQNTMADCTNSLPVAKSKRDIKRSLLGAKAV